MIFFDMRTIVFSYVLTDIVCTVVIVLLWRQNRKRFAGSGFWVFNYAFQLSAIFLILLRGQISAWMSFVLANTLVIAGSILGYMGLLRFIGKKSFQIHNYVLLAAFALVHAYFTFVQPNQAARNLNMSVGLLIICFQCAWLLLYRVESGMRQLTRGVGIIFAAYCFIGVVRIVEYFAGSHSTGDYLQSGIFEQLILISNQMLFILLTYFLVLMFNKRLLLDITTQEEKFNKAFHSSPYAITITRMSDGQIIEVNESFFKITGYQLADIREQTTIGMHLWDKAEDRAFVLSELTSKGKMQEREFQFRKKSGEIITGLFSAEIITVNNEKCVLSSINDITDRKRMGKVLEQSQHFLNLVIENTPNPMWISDKHGTVIIINESLRNLLKITDEEIIGIYNVQKDVQVEEQGFLPLVKSVFTEGKTVEFTIEYNTGKEKQVNLQTTTALIIDIIITPIIDEQGKVINAIAQHKDVTEHRKAKEEIFRLNVELEQKVAQRTRDLRDSQMALLSIVEDLNASNKEVAFANQSLDATNKELEAFSYSVSHDLRAPLRSVDAYARMIEEDYAERLDDEGRRLLKVIRDSAHDMGQLISDLLAFSRLSRKGLQMGRVGMRELFTKARLQVEQAETGRTIRWDIGEMPPAFGDEAMIREALINLLANAVKYTRPRQDAAIGISGRLDGDDVVYCVTDNGVGFDMAYKDKLFCVFQRLHSNAEFEGTGIGLALVQRIVQRHGGRVWAEGKVNEGATFYFSLPGKANEEGRMLTKEGTA